MAGSQLSGCPGDAEWAALLPHKTESTAGWKAEPPFRVQVERGSVLGWGPLAQPWGWPVPWLEAGEGHRWAVGCWKGSTDLVCLPCPECPRSTQPPIQGLQANARVLMAWGLHGLGEERWVRTSAPSPASLFCLSLPCCCVSLSRGHAHHCSSGVINSSKHSRCLQAKSILGEIPAIGSMFPLRASYLPLPAVCRSPWISGGANSPCHSAWQHPPG